VIWSWAGQVVLIVSGFVIPRLIDHDLGASALGIWDFGWSLVSHFGLIRGGITGSINRYVARFRSQGDIESLNVAVSSVSGVLRCMGAVVVILTLLCVWGMPLLLRESLSGHLNQARWLVLLLGLSLALQVSVSAYGGILTGCHRWGLHNGIYAITYSIMLVGMVAVLKLGYGLVGLAAVNLFCETLGRLARVRLSYKVCPGLEIRRRHMRWETSREMMGFGGKMFVYDCGSLVLGSTLILIIISSLGAPAVALFSRPMALIRIVKTFVVKYAQVFVPTASSLHVAGEIDEVRRLAVCAVRYGIMIGLPALLFLGIQGGELLGLWMGSNYADGTLILLLVLAHFFSIVYAPLYSILCGLNLHGRVGVVVFLGAVLGAAITLAWLSNGGRLHDVAFCFGVPWAFVNGVYLPVCACSRLRIPLGEFLRGVWTRPLMACFPFATWLVLVRSLDFGSRFQTLAIASSVGGLLLCATYWRFGFTPELKLSIRGRVVGLGKVAISRLRVFGS
jgi:O-antigen/teichoic acid export membrane protein